MNKTAITLPVLSDTMQTGRIARWNKQPGDAVKIGEVIAEIESDKAIMDVEAYVGGYLLGPLAPVDADLPVKSTIGWIADAPPQAGSAAAQAAEGAPAVQTARAEPAAVSQHKPQASAPAAQPVSETPPVAIPGAVQAAPPGDAAPARTPVVDAALAAREAGTGLSPFARGLAAELGVDPEQLRPGADGRIGAAQVLAAVLGPQMPHLELGPVHRIERRSPLKAAMADNMQRTVYTPTFHVTAAVDLRPLQAAAQERHQSLSLLLARASALAIQAHSDFNACWTPGGLARREAIDIAIAVDTPDGLITPVLRNAQRPLAELVADWTTLKGKVAHRRLQPIDYGGATFYLSNLGMFPGVEQFDAIVPLGVAAILAVAAPASDGLTRLTLTCDHRVVAGADAARFLATLSGHLGNVHDLMQ